MIEFIEIGLLLAIYLLIFYILGAALAVKLRWTMRRSQCLLIGFFAYFFVFQICAEAMILTQQPLHALKNLWLLVLSLMLIAGCSIIYADRERGGRPKEYIPNPAKGFFVLMILAILCQIATGLLLQRNLGWDFAYYMGNLTTSVSTDTMYVYDGSSGNLLQQLDLRYALSGFYMNTAVLSFRWHYYNRLFYCRPVWSLSRPCTSAGHDSHCLRSAIRPDRTRCPTVR